MCGPHSPSQVSTAALALFLLPIGLDPVELSCKQITFARTWRTRSLSERSCCPPCLLPWLTADGASTRMMFDLFAVPWAAALPNGDRVHFDTIRAGFRRCASSSPSTSSASASHATVAVAASAPAASPHDHTAMPEPAGAADRGQRRSHASAVSRAKTTTAAAANA